MENRNICVLGASGYLGENLFRYNSRNYADINFFYCSRTTEHPYINKVEYSQEFLSEYFQENNIKEVWYLVSPFVPIDGSDVFASLNDLDVIEYVLKAMASSSVKNMVYFSSAGTLNLLESSTRFVEDKLPLLRTSYALFKNSEESLARAFCSQNNIDLLVLRISNVYGHPKTGKKNGLVNVLEQNIRRNKLTKIYADLETTHDYIYVDDLFNVLYSLRFSAHATGVFNIASGTTYSIGEILQLFTKKYPLLNYELSIEPNIYRESRSISIKKLIDQIGIVNFKNIQEYLDEI